VKAQDAKRRAALALSKRLHEASKATNAFLSACFEAGEPGRGLDDGRVLLIHSMMEYANYLDSVCDKETP
jgi:hypothetical protein